MRKKGFTLVVLVSILGIASVIICSQKYTGRVVRDVSIEFTNRVIRDLSAFAEGIRQKHIQHMNYRARLVSGDPTVTQETVSTLWTTEAINEMLQTFPGISTINNNGTGKEVPVKPSVTCAVLKNEVLPGGEVIPETISITITVNSRRSMYSHTMKDAVSRFLKSTYIAGMDFDFDTLKSVRMTVVIGQGAGIFGPMRNL